MCECIFSSSCLIAPKKFLTTCPYIHTHTYIDTYIHTYIQARTASPRESTSPTLPPQPSSGGPLTSQPASEPSENVRNLKQKLSMLKGVFPLTGGRSTQTQNAHTNNSTSHSTAQNMSATQPQSAATSNQSTNLVLEDVDETDHSKGSEVTASTPRQGNNSHNQGTNQGNNPGGFSRTASNESVGVKTNKPVIIPPLALPTANNNAVSESESANGEDASAQAGFGKIGFKANVFDRLTAQRNLVAACKAR